MDADAAGVRVRNLAVTRELPWQAVRAVRFDPKSPWAALLLENGDEMSVLAVQAIDKEYAVGAVEELRRLHRAARANDPKPPRPAKAAADARPMPDFNLKSIEEWFGKKLG